MPKWKERLKQYSSYDVVSNHLSKQKVHVISRGSFRGFCFTETFWSLTESSQTDEEEEIKVLIEKVLSSN